MFINRIPQFGYATERFGVGLLNNLTDQDIIPKANNLPNIRRINKTQRIATSILRTCNGCRGLLVANAFQSELNCSCTAHEGKSTNRKDHVCF